MLGLLLAISVLWALRWPAPRSVRTYLFAQLLYTNVVWFLKPAFGTATYRVAYCSFTLIILMASANIVAEGLCTRLHRARALAVALVLTVTLARIAYVGLERPPSLDTWIILTEGSLLTLLGMLMSFLAAYQRNPEIGLILGFLWLALAFYDFGFILHEWGNINWIAPALTCIVGFTLLGWRLRRETSVATV